MSEQGELAIKLVGELAGILARSKDKSTGLLGQRRDNQRWLRGVRGIRMGRAGTDDDVAELVILFVSDHAAHISGQMINVDGGSVRS